MLRRILSKLLGMQSHKRHGYSSSDMHHKPYPHQGHAYPKHMSSSDVHYHPHGHAPHNKYGHTYYKKKHSSSYFSS